MCTTCYDNFLYRCHNNKLANLSGILIWALLDIIYIYKHCRKQTVACRSHIPVGTLPNCKCKTSFEWSKIQIISDRRKKNQCLKLVYLLFKFFLEILKGINQKSIEIEIEILLKFFKLHQLVGVVKSWMQSFCVERDSLFSWWIALTMTYCVLGVLRTPLQGCVLSLPLPRWVWLLVAKFAMKRQNLFAQQPTGCLLSWL